MSMELRRWEDLIKEDNLNFPNNLIKFFLTFYSLFIAIYVVFSSLVTLANSVYVYRAILYEITNSNMEIVFNILFQAILNSFRMAYLFIEKFSKIIIFVLPIYIAIYTSIFHIVLRKLNLKRKKLKDEIVTLQMFEKCVEKRKKDFGSAITNLIGEVSYWEPKNLENAEITVYIYTDLESDRDVIKLFTSNMETYYKVTNFKNTLIRIWRGGRSLRLKLIVTDNFKLTKHQKFSPIPIIDDAKIKFTNKYIFKKYFKKDSVNFEKLLKNVFAIDGVEKISENKVLEEFVSSKLGEQPVEPKDSFSLLFAVSINDRITYVGDLLHVCACGGSSSFVVFQDHSSNREG